MKTAPYSSMQQCLILCCAFVALSACSAQSISNAKDRWCRAEPSCHMNDDGAAPGAEGW